MTQIPLHMMITRKVFLILMFCIFNNFSFAQKEPLSSMKNKSLFKKEYSKDEFDSLIYKKLVRLLRNDKIGSKYLQLFCIDNHNYFIRVDNNYVYSLKDESEYFLKINVVQLVNKIYSYRDMTEDDIAFFKSNISIRVSNFIHRNNIEKENIQIGLIKKEIQNLFTDPFQNYFEYASVICELNSKKFPRFSTFPSGKEKRILMMQNEGDKNFSPFDAVNKIYEDLLLKDFPNFYKR